MLCEMWSWSWLKKYISPAFEVVRAGKTNTKIFEPQHEKNNKMTCVPSNDRSAWAPTQSDQSLRCELIG